MTSDKLERLFCSRIEEMGAELDAAALSLRGQPDNVEALEEVYRIAHSLHGSGKMYGCSAVSDLGGSLEKIARSVRDEALAMEPEIIDLIGRCAAGLQTLNQTVTDEFREGLKGLDWECQCILHDSLSREK